MAQVGKILIVDDDPDMVESMRLILESRGYETSSASSAEEGLTSARAQRPDLVLLDVMMPDGIEGFHFVWNLRQDPDPALSGTPIIVVTAIHERSQVQFYPDTGDGAYEPGEYLPVQDFVDKPVQPADLLARVARHIRG